MGSGGSKTLWSSGKYCFLVLIFILNLALAMFYFHMGNPHYHRRCFVSLLSSAWGQVGPKRYSHQEILFINEVSLINVNPEKAIKFFVYFSLLTSVAYKPLWRCMVKPHG